VISSLNITRAYGTQPVDILLPWVETHGYKIDRADGPFKNSNKKGA
jgi:hypothetical protein